MLLFIKLAFTFRFSFISITIYISANLKFTFLDVIHLMYSNKIVSLFTKYASLFSLFSINVEHFGMI